MDIITTVGTETLKKRRSKEPRREICKENTRDREKEKAKEGKKNDSGVVPDLLRRLVSCSPSVTDRRKHALCINPLVYIHLESGELRRPSSTHQGLLFGEKWNEEERREGEEESLRKKA